jgi:hypothetical protein
MLERLDGGVITIAAGDVFPFTARHQARNQGGRRGGSG